MGAYTQVRNSTDYLGLHASQANLFGILQKSLTKFRMFKTHYCHYPPVSAQPVGSAVLLSVALNSNDMHFCCALLCVFVDTASIGLKLWSHANATCNGTASSNLCHHSLLPAHLACRTNHTINSECPDGNPDTTQGRPRLQSPMKCLGLVASSQAQSHARLQ